MDPNLNQAIECLLKLKQQLQQLFHPSVRSDPEITDSQTDAMQPVDDCAPSSPSPEAVIQLNEQEAELPALAPLAVPQFDFAMLSSVKFDDDV